jgi:hypothetical protein
VRILSVQFTVRRIMFWVVILAVELAVPGYVGDYFARCAGQSKLNDCYRRPMSGLGSLEVVNPEE